MRNTVQRANFILTALGIRAKGFYTPYDHIDLVSLPEEPYPEILRLFEASLDEFSSFIESMHRNEDFFLDSDTGSPRPNWTSRYISRLDGAAIYTAVTRHRPRRIVEIGSGNSSLFLLRAVADHRLPTEVICIDPAPRIAIDHLPIRLLKRPLHLDDVALAAELAEGDILFVDSSHILQPGFDLDIILNLILPKLRSGVIVHFHDIFLPYPYPAIWARYRFNEQNALIAWLLSGHFTPLFSSHYVWRDMTAQLVAACPRFPLNTPENGGSLWLRRV